MAELSQHDLLVYEMCNPHKNTELGKGTSYDKFITYVINFLKPHMSMDFVEEKYYEEIISEIWKNKNCVEQLPRGHSKTEMIGIWLTIYIADYQPINPFYLKYKGKRKQMTEQVIIAGAMDDLNAWTERIKDYFDTVPILQRLKPLGAKRDRTTNKWNNKTMSLRNGHKLHLRSLKGKIRGLHVDRVIADDLITESSTLTDKQSINIWDGAVDGITTAKEAMVNVIGTPLRFTDIQFHLKDKPEGYHFKARPAIIDWENKIVLSPKRKSFADLMRVKARIGSTKFATEYMLNPIDDSVSLIKRDHMRSCLDPYFEGLWLNPHITRTGKVIEVKIQKLNTVKYRRADWEELFVTTDFAFSDRTTADWTVMSYYGLKRERLYRLGYIRGKGWSTNEQFEIMKSLKDYLGVSMFGLEENSIKGVVKDIKHLNLPIKLFWMGAQDKAPSYKPEVSFSDKRWVIGKIMGIERLDASYENQKFVIPYKSEMDKNHAEMEIEEATSWALDEGRIVEIGRHPDIPITAMLVNEMQSHVGNGIDLAVVGPGGALEGNDEERKIIKSQGILGE